jgi:hypothetical protein
MRKLLFKMFGLLIFSMLFSCKNRKYTKENIEHIMQGEWKIINDSGSYAKNTVMVIKFDTLLVFNTIKANTDTAYLSRLSFYAAGFIPRYGHGFDILTVWKPDTVIDYYDTGIGFILRDETFEIKNSNPAFSCSVNLSIDSISDSIIGLENDHSKRNAILLKRTNEPYVRTRRLQ